MLGLFEQVVPEYSDEPIVKLLKNNCLKGDDPSKLIGLSLVKVQIFLILSSETEMETKVKKLIRLLQIEDKRIKKEEATKILQIFFEMCTSELAVSFAQIGYSSKDLIAT